MPKGLKGFQEGNMCGIKYRYKKGQKPTNSPFIKGTHLREENYNWKGGRQLDKDGYVIIRNTNHPYHNKHGYVQEHRLIMEAHIGRYLLPEEVVHHINGIRSDNRIENLMLFSCNGEHLKFHQEALCPK